MKKKELKAIIKQQSIELSKRDSRIEELYTIIDIAIKNIKTILSNDANLKKEVKA